MLRRVMILGAGFEFCGLVIKAKQMGCYVVVCDGYADAPAKKLADKAYTADVREIDAITDICKQERIDNIITSFSDILLECMVKISYAAGLQCYIKPEKISLNVESLNLHVGETKVLSATIFPENASMKEIVWSVDNIDVVTVEDGKITAKGIGSANVTAKLKDFQISASCKINVSAADTESIELEKSEYTLIKGKKLDINPIIKPEYAQNKEYTVISSNEKIVKVDGKSLVGVDVGEAEVTFKLINKDLQVTVKIKVIDVDESDYISFDNSLDVNEEKSYITKIEPETSVKDFISKINYNSEKFFVSVKDISGKEISGEDLVGTGTTISLNANDSKEDLQLFTIIIYGDVNGDGNIYATDYVKIKNHIMEVEKLNGACMEAADVDHDGNIYATDYVKIKNYIMQSGEISQ